MPNCYLWLPHYVAAYHRYTDESYQLSPSEPLRIDTASRHWSLLYIGLTANPKGRISKAGCFSESQWQRMSAGQYIAPNPRRLPPIDMSDVPYPTEEEVSQLAGFKAPRGDNTGDYLCIRLPREAPFRGMVVRTTPQWMLSEAGARRLSKSLTDEFWMMLKEWINRYVIFRIRNDMDRSFMDALERFMLRYDINNSLDGHEKKNIKRNFYRRFPGMRTGCGE